MSTERTGLRVRYRHAEKRESRHPIDCRCGEHDRPLRTSGREERDENPERQHVPFLSLWVDDMGEAAFDLVRARSLTVELTNHGNAASFTPIVELCLQDDAGRVWRAGMAQLDPLYPHGTATSDVPWSWQSLIPLNGSPHISVITAADRFLVVGQLTIVAYDPTLDPRPPTPFDPWNQAPHHRKVLTIPYWHDVHQGP